MGTKTENPKVIVLKEWETTPNPIYLNTSEAYYLENNFKREVNLTPSRERNHYQISARQYVGSIVFGEKEIYIQPKINNANIFYMLSYTLGLPEFREGFAGQLTTEDIFEIIVWNYIKRLEVLLTRGLYKNYKEVQENLGFIKGQLKINENLRNNLTNRHLNVCSYSEFTEDTLENQILKYALSILLGKRYRNKQVRQKLYHCFLQMEQVSLRVIEGCDFERLHYTRLNNHYKGLHSLARLFIHNTSLSNEKGQIKISSFLLDMNKLFEDFVRNYLKEQLEKHPCIKVHKRKETLDVDNKVKIIPDIIIALKGRPVLILDTKYKRLAMDEVKHADLYQIYAYCNILGIENGLLIYGEGEGATYEAKVPCGLKLQAKVLKLEGNYQDFKAECVKLSNYVLNNLPNQKTAPIAGYQQVSAEYY